MKTASVRDLRNNFSVLEAWLEEGETIQIEKRGAPIALLTAIAREPSSPRLLPDFGARRRAIWGERTYSEEEVQQMREDERSWPQDDRLS